MSDEERYRIFLQESLLTSGWEAAFDHDRLKNWLRSNREKLQANAKSVLGEFGLEYVEKFSQAVEEFKPVSKYDLPITNAIFEPHLSAVIETAHTIGVLPIRQIDLITSTSISPTPYARPTNDTHQLFVGLGTSMFCNYWAKAYTGVVRGIGAKGPPYNAMSSAQQIRESFSDDISSFLLAARLAMYFGATGTLLGFGKIEQPLSYLAYRAELCAAMEHFVIAHEYAHFIAFERGLEEGADGEGLSGIELEYFCDEMGLKISSEWGAKNKNWLAFTGLGAIALFRSLEVCLDCTSRLANVFPALQPLSRGGASRNSTTHPAAADRVERLIDKAIEGTCDEQKKDVEAFLREYDLILRTINEDILDIVRDAFGDQSM